MFGKRKDRKAREEDPAASYEDTKSGMREAAGARELEARKTLSEGADALLGKLESDEAARRAPRAAALRDVEMALPGAKKAAAAPAKPAAASMTLRRGVFNNNDVRRLQTDLKDLAAALKMPELDPGAVDGDFGGNTEKALKALQMQLGMKPTGTADAALRDRVFELRKDAVIPGKRATPLPPTYTKQNFGESMQQGESLQSRLGESMQQGESNQGRVADESMQVGVSARDDLTTIHRLDPGFVRSLPDTVAANLLESLNKRSRS